MWLHFIVRYSDRYTWIFRLYKKNVKELYEKLIINMNMELTELNPIYKVISLLDT